MRIKINQIFTLLAIISIYLLIRNLLSLRFVQPAGYVVDIYSLFPLTFYLSFIFCYITSAFLVLSNHKKVGLLILCLNHLEILLIPYMLGYYSMGRADAMQYIGEYSQIIKSGHFSNWDIYPASHILGAFISLLSNIEAHHTSLIVPIVFSFIFILGVNVLSRELISDSFICSLVLVSSFVLYLGTYNFLNAPHALFFSFMPLYLCSFHKYLLNFKNLGLSAIFVIMTLVIPFSHPFIVFFVLFVFLVHFIPKIKVSSRFNVLKVPPIRNSTFLLLVVAFTSWFIYFTIFLAYFKQSLLSYIDRITTPVFFETTEKIAEINLDFFGYLRLISFFYGRYTIPTIFIFLSFIFIYRNRGLLNLDSLKNYSYLLTLYFACLASEFILLFNPIFSHQPERITNLNFIVYFQILLFSCALYVIFFKNSINFGKILQVCSILALVWSLSLFGCFDSPCVFRTNSALTYNEVNGMDWFFHVKDDSVVLAPVSAIGTFYDLLGYAKSNKFSHISDHFGYVSESDILGKINLDEGDKAYIIILTLDELLYQKVPGYMKVGRYTSSDFIRFRKDISVNKIYDSTNIEIFKSYNPN